MNTKNHKSNTDIRLRLLGGLVLIVLSAAGLSLLLRNHRPQGGPSPASTGSTSVSALQTGASSAGGETEGWSIAGEKAYYRGQDMQLYTGEREIGGVSYHFLDDGSLEEGWLSIAAARYHVSGGVLSKGWRTIDGKRYYFGTDGVLACNTTVDGVRLGEDGAALPDTTQEGSTSTPATAPPTTAPDTQPTANLSEKLSKQLDQILDKYGRTPQNIYDYVHDHYKYKYVAEKSLEENAQHLLDYGTGSCYNFAALTYLLFQRAGYNVHYVTGLGWQHGTYHCWILANFDGGWYYVDSLYVRSAKLTAAQLEKIGYKWDKDAFPS